MQNFEVVIVGAGPIGLTCGIEAIQRNKSYLIIEKSCLVNSLFHYPTNMTFFSTLDKIEIWNVPFVSHGDKPTRREALEYYRRVREYWNLNVNIYEQVEEIEKTDSRFIITTNKEHYTAKNIIIATGFYDHANLLNIPGENLPKVYHYFTEAHPFAFMKIAVIGAGNSAVDVALETFRRGSDVTMIIREDSLKNSVKYWVKPDIENRINEDSIKAYFDSEVIEIKDNEIIIKSPDGIKHIENDFVFAMTGYHPDYNFLNQIGIKLSGDDSKTPIYNEETFETNIVGVYLARIVCGRMETNKWFIENSREHSKNIFDHICSKQMWCLYTFKLKSLAA